MERPKLRKSPRVTVYYWQDGTIDAYGHGGRRIFCSRDSSGRPERSEHVHIIAHALRNENCRFVAGGWDNTTPFLKHSNRNFFLNWVKRTKPGTYLDATCHS